LSLLRHGPGAHRADALPLPDHPVGPTDRVDAPLLAMPGVWSRYFPPSMRNLSSCRRLDPTPPRAARAAGTWVPSFARAATEIRGLYPHRGLRGHHAPGHRDGGSGVGGRPGGGVERLLAETPPPPAGPPVALFSVDGAIVPLVGGEWARSKP
jgi:hypothetical protein